LAECCPVSRRLDARSQTFLSMVRLFNVHYPKRTLVLAASEVLLVLLALLVPMTVQFLGDIPEVPSFGERFLKLLLAAAIVILCAYYLDLYSPSTITNSREVWTRAMMSLGASCIVLAAVYAMLPATRLPQNVILPGIVLTSLAFVGSRRAFSRLNRSARMAESAILLGAGPLIKRLAEEVTSRPELGIRLVGYVGHPLPNGSEPAGKLPFLGEAISFGEIIREKPVDRVIVTMSDRRGTLPVNDLLHLKTQGTLVEDGAQFYETISGRMPVDAVRPGAMLFSHGFHVSQSLLLKKRLYSLIISGLALALLSPVMVLVALAVAIESPGRVLFRQKRVGLGGRVFEILKFRSMRVGAESATGPVWAQDQDPRITRVGRVLRKLRLDELPQLINILRGDMSVVGPRPERPHFVEMLSEQIPYYGLRHSVPPGLTGWAQVSYPYGSTVEESREKLEYDLFYVKNMSLSLDLLILFSTLKIVLLGKGAK
jgi:sugar transferase (PEP-CTERM system associated)